MKSEARAYIAIIAYAIVLAAIVVSGMYFTYQIELAKLVQTCVCGQ